MNTNVKYRLPHYKYIQALIVGRQSAEAIVEELNDLKLEVIPQLIQRIYQDLKQAEPEFFKPNPKQEYPEPDYDWLTELDILDMYGYRFKKPVPLAMLGIQGAFKLLDDTKLREVIFPLALAGIDHEDIELTCTGRFDINYEPTDFVKFLQYFGNFKTWTSTDKELYVNTVQDTDLKENYKLALKGDKNYLLWKLGAAPNKSFDQMLREMFTDSFYYFKEKQKKDADTAQRWGMLAVKISDRLDKIDSDDKGKQSLYEQVKFTLKEDQPKSEEVVDLRSIGAEVPDVDSTSLPDLEALKEKANL
jgi:hypothetical protein